MRAFFSKFGKVVDATVMVDRETGRSKGFGFVTFEDNSNDSQLVGKLGLILDDKQVRLYFIRVVLRSLISLTRFRLKLRQHSHAANVINNDTIPPRQTTTSTPVKLPEAIPL